MITHVALTGCSCSPDMGTGASRSIDILRRTRIAELSKMADSVAELVIGRGTFCPRLNLFVADSAFVWFAPAIN